MRDDKLLNVGGFCDFSGAETHNSNYNVSFSLLLRQQSNTKMKPNEQKKSNAKKVSV